MRLFSMRAAGNDSYLSAQSDCRCTNEDQVHVMLLKSLQRDLTM